MAVREADGTIRLSDGRKIYANSLLNAGDLCEIFPLICPPPAPAFPFISGGGGAPGPRGAAGAPGADGVPGNQGPQGLNGSSGGAQGVQGPQGFGSGTQGSQGSQGSGAQGSQGSQGQLPSDLFASTRIVSLIPGDGTDLTIAAAIAALPAAGGYIYVKQGTYPNAVTLVMPDKPVVIKGSGDGTVIDLGASAIPAFTIPNGLTAVRAYVFEDFKVIGTSVPTQKIWSIEESNSRGVVSGTRVNSEGIQYPMHITAGGGTEPVTVNLNDCHFVPIADGTGILVNTPLFAGVTANVFMNNVRFYNIFEDAITGALTAGGFFVDFTGVNIIGQGCLFSIGTGNTMGSLNLIDSEIYNFGPGVVNPLISTADDNFGLIPTELIGCGAAFVNFNFTGNGAHCYGGFFDSCSFVDAAVSFFSDCYFFDDLAIDTAVIIGTGATSVTGCFFDNKGTLFVLDGNFNSIVGNRFQNAGVGLTAIIRTTNGSAAISDNRFPNNVVPAILEAGTVSTNNIDNNRWLTGPTLIAASDAIENGFRRKDVTGGVTVAGFVNVFTHVNAKGLAGSGSIKNTGPFVSLEYRVEVTDSYGTVSTQVFTVGALATAFWDVSAVFTGALPPYVSFGISVNAPGAPTTYDLRHSSVGAN